MNITIPNTSADDDHLTALMLGTSYYLQGNTRLSLNYELLEDHLNPDLGNLFTVQMQVAL
ncbi:hypothetical protein NC796_11015 [Aliifodinibius sp. S!AR15-10]|uniref:hypothetical protein n=1 Tax=Aliifodinibius sp. S!AR15-10 TaxID=2950437 RepID=UPI0028555B91|nr:hypothetical protein [Aliifodinibius sp. S!AR15-10]MDR8391675.1 hypothetical protein [Aliifodinibius sp. S!AR15-10]